MWRFTLIICLAFCLAPAHAENLILISVDTLRADRLSCYGSKNPTPGFDRWAREGILFEHAFAEVPLTLPSHSTLLTGTLPIYHGVRDNAGFNLPETQITLAEILAERGFETAAFVSSYILASRFGVAQGFSTYGEVLGEREELLSASLLSRPASETTDLALDWLTRRGDRPFFLWLHFFDPHAPNPGGYEEEVQRVDRQLTRLDGYLRDAGLLQETHIVLVSDHGESLGEHGESAHGFFIYDSTLRVPWIIRPADSVKVQKKLITTAYSLVDVAPSVLQMLGIPLPDQLQGQSAWREILGRKADAHPLYSENYSPNLQFGWSRLKSIRLGRYKYIDAPRIELYDTQTDPGETGNLAGENRALASQLREQLLSVQTRYQSMGSGQAAAPVDSETAARLAALGYASISSGKVMDSAPQGADPKDKIAGFERYQSILSQISQPTPAALQEIRALRRTEPEFRGLDYLEAVFLETLGDLELAREAYLQELAANPGNNAAKANLANVQLRLKEPGLAHELYQEVVKADPNNFRARNNLGLLWRMKGFIGQAAEEFETVTRQAPGYVAGWINYGSTLAILGKLDLAESAFRKAIETDPSFAEAHFHLSQVLAAAGRKDEALLERELAAKLDPRFRP